jgi:hypothetical protein
LETIEILFLETIEILFLETIEILLDRQTVSLQLVAVAGTLVAQMVMGYGIVLAILVLVVK